MAPNYDTTKQRTSGKRRGEMQNAPRDAKIPVGPNPTPEGVTSKMPYLPREVSFSFQGAARFTKNEIRWGAEVRCHEPREMRYASRGKFVISVLRLRQRLTAAGQRHRAARWTGCARTIIAPEALRVPKCELSARATTVAAGAKINRIHRG